MKVNSMGRVKVEVNDRVRIVQANGCMAHVRENPREGVVIGFCEQKGPGWSDVQRDERTYARIRLDDGTIISKPAVSRLWNIHEGLPEYQE